MHQKKYNSRNSNTTMKSLFFRRRYKCPLCSARNTEINYKNPELIKKFISEGGRILPSRITNVCAKHQRTLKVAIKIARNLALLPFVYLPNKGY